MDLDLSDDQVALRDGIAQLLAGRFDSDRIRAGFDRAMHDELAAAGVFSLRSDGFSWADCVVVFEQLGRCCVPGPLVGTLLLGEGAITEIVDGTPRAGSRDGSMWIPYVDLLDAVIVLDGDTARRAIPAAFDADPSPWPLDPLTPVARATKMPDGDRLDVDITSLRRAGALLTAAFQLGLTDRLAEMAVDYAKERTQFDRPIGSFQAVKHLCADMAVRTEVARAAVYAAGAHLDAADVPGVDRAIAGAKALAGEAAIANGKSATQVHGGMGFTWEVDVHLYLKRAWVLDTRFGSAAEHCDALAASLPLPV
jgi:alkylation response protein AidB-like acyl-CoA dehydrogenase